MQTLNRVRELREKLGISRRALSRQTGIDYYVLLHIEKNEYPFYPKYRRLIAEALGVSEEDLFVKDGKGNEVKA